MSQTNTNGNHVLKEKLENPAIVASLNRLLDRIEALEESVNTLHNTIREAPGMAAMATDIVDEALRNAREAGVDINQRSKNALMIANRLTEDKTVKNLHTILDAAQEAPGLLTMVADMFDAEMRRASESGIDIEERLRGILQLAMQLTNPDVLAVMQSGLKAAPTLPGLVSMATDMVDEQISGANTQGIDLGQRIKSIVLLTGKLTDPQTIASMDHILDPVAMETVGALGSAIAKCKNQPLQPLGLLGMARAFRDPDVQKAASFLIEIAKSMGQELNSAN